MTQDTQAQKISILQAALKLIPSSGWSEEILEHASVSAGFSKGYGKLLFVGGIKELVSLYVTYIDELMLAKLSGVDMSTLGISAKIKLALKTRIKVLASYKPVVARTVSYLSMPWNAPLGLSLMWHTVDLIWREVAGDASHDFNYYTKRGLLYGVYAASIQFFLSDESKNHQGTDAFIDRRIDDVLQLGRWISKCRC
jgi:ubiquinone biosynthesis protein COQ9